MKLNFKKTRNPKEKCHVAVNGCSPGEGEVGLLLLQKPPMFSHVSWCSSWETWPQFVTAVSVCHSSPTLPPPSPTPPVWFLQESIKRPIRCSVSQSRDPRSAVRQRQTLCWGLSYAFSTGVIKKKKLPAWSVTFELTFWPIQLTSCRKIQTRSFEKSNRCLRKRAPDRSEASVKYTCLNFVYTAAFLSKKKKQKNSRSCNWQSFYRLPAWN